MNINTFFIIILTGLGMIYIFFKPLHIKKQKFVDVPQFELTSFTMYELDKEGLKTLMNGTKAIKYSNRYTINDINYTDNAKSYRANMIAKYGIYKNNVVKLNGNVIYKREDGLTFKTQKARYNRVSKVAITNTKYIMFMGKDKVTGTYLRYNTLTKNMKSKNIIVNYEIKER